MTENFKIKFHVPIRVLIYAKLHKILVTLTLTKLYHIERYHLVNFYISLEKHKNATFL